MGYNFGTGLSGAGAGALAAYDSTGNGYAAIGGALLGSLAGFNSGSSANMLSMQDMYNLEMYNTAKQIFMMNQQQNMNEYLMNQSNKLSQSNMRFGADLQKELNEQAFKYNNYFIDNAYQKTVQDMKKAGLNPILAAGHANVGSAQSGGVSGASASAGSVSQANGAGVDLPSMMSASANSAQAKIAKGQLALNTANVLGDVAAKQASSAYAVEQAKTESFKRENLHADSLLKGLQSAKQEIENSNLDSHMKSEIKKNIATAESSMILAQVEDYLKEFKAYNLVHSANAQESQAAASHISAWAQNTIANATSQKMGEEAYGMAIENDFNRKHPGVYGTERVLRAIGPLVSLVGPGLIARGLAKKDKPKEVKQVISAPPAGYRYGN